MDSQTPLAPVLPGQPDRPIEAMDQAEQQISVGALLSYGLFGLPLALVALPIYVYVPQFYSERFGMSLSLIGAALLAARLLDAFIDPVLGLWMDRSKHCSGRLTSGFGRFILLSLPLLAAGYLALFHPPDVAAKQPLAWFMAALVTVYIGFSMASIAHQSWGAALTQAVAQRSRLTGTREACGLCGVVIAAAIPGIFGMGWLSLLFVVTLVGSGALLVSRAPRPPRLTPVHSGAGAIMIPFRNPYFRWLFAVFLLNGIAAAIPATLFLFFAKDRLQLAQYAGLFLVLYFAAAALSMPLWVNLARRFGESRAWLVGMALSVTAFAWVYGLAPGAMVGFAAVCAISGMALGADLALPPALLAAVIARAGHSGQREGAYFGAWNWATKLNLALAAGISLPLLDRFGYVPGVVDANGVQALSLAYAVLPCILKLGAAALLWRAPLKSL